MQSTVAEFVVQGITLEGEVLEPASWAERLRDSLPKVASCEGMDLSDYVRPIISEGDVSLVVRIVLKDVNPQAFEMIKKFIFDNGLMVRAGRGSRDAEEAVRHLPAGKERRNPSRNDW